MADVGWDLLGVVCCEVSVRLAGGCVAHMRTVQGHWAT
jgi:hypothetical protein